MTAVSGQDTGPGPPYSPAERGRVGPVLLTRGRGGWPARGRVRARSGPGQGRVRAARPKSRHPPPSHPPFAHPHSSQQVVTAPNRPGTTLSPPLPSPPCGRASSRSRLVRGRDSVATRPSRGRVSSNSPLLLLFFSPPPPPPPRGQQIPASATVAEPAQERPSRTRRHWAPESPKKSNPAHHRPLQRPHSP